MLVNKDYVIILFAPNVMNIGLDVLALFENVIGVKFSDTVLFLATVLSFHEC